VESGKWKVESGKWKVESGKWKVESGKWKVESGRKSLKINNFMFALVWLEFFIAFKGLVFLQAKVVLFLVFIFASAFL